MKTAIILSNAVHARLHEADREAKLIVQKALQYTVEGHEASIQFKSGRWDGKSSFFDFRKCSFPAGFVHFVTAHLRREGYEVRHVKKPLPPALGPVFDPTGSDPRWDYQPQVVEKLVKHGQIIAQVATGGGKSRIGRLAFKRINRPTLFLTTRQLLMYQMAEGFEEDGVSVSILGDGSFGHVRADGRSAIKKMSVGMVQTLAARLQDPNPKHSKAKQVQQAAIKAQTIELLGKFEFVMLEEAHESSGDSYFQIMSHCKNAYYRLALTATPFMKSDEEANMRLHAVSGPIGMKVSEKLLIDRGILAKPYFKYIRLLRKPEHMLRNLNWQAAYRIGIVENPERNASIVFEVSRGVQHGLTAMVLVQHTKHGEILLEMMKKAKLRAIFIQGSDSHEERKVALGYLGAGKIDVLIGTTILDVGVDVPAVGMMVLAGGGKAEVALRQRIGRTLRAKKTGSNVCFVVDYEDRFNTNLLKHSMQRREIVEGTEGFCEGILPAGADFDFSGLGFLKAA